MLRRRELIKGVVATPLASLSGARAFWTAAQATPLSRVRPGDTGWPGEDKWADLHRAVGGRMHRVVSPLDACRSPRDEDACDAVFRAIRNPYFIGDEPALTQTLGWIDAWDSRPSTFCVAARSTADVAAAVDFARSNNLRLVVRGGGHSYLGTSNAPDSLMIWTRNLRDIVMHDAFVGRGCEGHLEPQPAVSVGSGALWMHVYDVVTTKGGRYVQGGGCGTVSVGGLIQGGGFGSYSRFFGTAGSNLIEAEIVTADGRTRVVNACAEPDLCWALKGGGGGTLGVVTRVTLKTHPLPDQVGVVIANIKARSDASFRDLLLRTIEFVGQSLLDRHWGETITLRPSNTLDIALEFIGLSEAQVRAIWRPFTQWIVSQPETLSMSPPVILATSARNRWNTDFLKATMPGAVMQDDRHGAPHENVFWANNAAEVGQYIHGFESLWLPRALVELPNRQRLADALFGASRSWSVSLHLQKGLAGGSPNAIAASRDTPINPAALEAFALAIVAGNGPPAVGGLLGHEPNADAGRRQARAIRQAAAALRPLVTEPAAYAYECNYFEADWQRAHWGAHYERLVDVKRAIDPSDLFIVHHGIGSERWSADGFSRIK